MKPRAVLIGLALLLVGGCSEDSPDVPEQGFDVGDCVTAGEQPELVDCDSPDAAGEVIAEAGLLGDVEECPPETNFVVRVTSGNARVGPDYCVAEVEAS